MKKTKDRIDKQWMTMVVTAYSRHWMRDTLPVVLEIIYCSRSCPYSKPLNSGANTRSTNGKSELPNTRKSCWELARLFILYTVKKVVSGPHIKRKPCVKWTPAGVPKFSSHVYCKINLYSVDSSREFYF